MRTKLRKAATKAFLISAGLVLTATALAKLYSTLGNMRILNHPDDLFALSYRWILFGVGAVELAVVCVLLFHRVDRVKLLSLLWLSSMFVLYRGAKWYFQVSGPCKCLGSLTESLSLKPATVEVGLTWIVAYLFLGSLFWLGLEWWLGRRKGAALSCVRGTFSNIEQRTSNAEP